MKRFKNNKETSDTWVGQEIQSGNYYEIEPSELFKWQNNSKVISDIGSGNGIINDGTVDITDVATAINFLKDKDTIPKDSDGSPLQRIKITTTGWKAQFHILRISTSTANGIRSKKKDGTDLGFCTYTMYDENNETTEVPASCVKTVVTWEPNHDMEIVGGQMLQQAPPTSNIYMYVTAAAHIPAQYGGSIAFLEGGINLADVGIGGTVDFDGKAPKYIAYDPVNHSGRFEIELQHDPGIQHSFSLAFKIYKS